MFLLDLWERSRNEIEGKQVQQIIAVAGSGKLLDGNDASAEFRDLLAQLPSSILQRYADECLANKFDGNGFALQDVINQVGRRLGFQVSDGRYRGVPGQVGYDGLWTLSSGQTIVVEVKTSDAYRIDLNTVAEYRQHLIKDGKTSEDKSSILIVVGRQDTGDLEAQIRGSRHAWDIRLISVDALLGLMGIKEKVEDPQNLRKISGILIPQEFTRVDGIIDLVFSTTTDVLEGEVEDEVKDQAGSGSGQTRPPSVPVKFNDACILRIQIYFKRTLIKQTRVTYSTPDNTLSVVCAVSKEYVDGDIPNYWFAFHPHQKDKLKAAAEGYVAFGCGSEKTILLIPVNQFEKWLDGMNMTQLGDRSYWHVSIFRDADNLVLRRKRGFERITLTKFLLP